MFFNQSDALEALKSNDISENFINLVRENLPEAPRDDKQWAPFYGFVLSIDEFSLKKRLWACKLYIELQGKDIFILQRIINLIGNVVVNDGLDKTRSSSGANDEEDSENRTNTTTVVTNSHHKQCIEICEQISEASYDTNYNQFIIQKFAEFTRQPKLGVTTADKLNNGTKTRRTNTKSFLKLPEMHRKLYDAFFNVLEKLCERGASEANGQQEQFLTVLKHLSPNLKHPHRHVSERTTKFLLDTQDKVDSWEDCIYILLQQLVIKCALEKADIKNIAVVSIITLFKAIESDSTHCENFIQYLEAMVRNVDGHRRLFSVECICKLLEHMFTDSTSSLESGSFKTSLVERLMVALIYRFPDRNSLVRTKSLTGFSNILKVGCQTEDTRELLIEIVSKSGDISEKGDDSLNASSLTAANNEDAMDIDTPQDRSINGDQRMDAAPQDHLTSNTGMIGRRVYDVCSPVRKAAIQAIGQLAVLCPSKFLTLSFIDILKYHSMDETLTNRKQSLSTLSMLFQTFPDNEYVYRNLLIVIFILITDQETTVLTKSLEAAKKYFMQMYSKKRTQKFVFSALNSLPRTQLSRVKILFSVLYKEKILKSSHLTSVQDFIIEENNYHAAAWVLYEDLSQYFAEDVDTLFIKQIYQEIENIPQEDRSPEQSQIFYLCINILSKVCHLCSEDERKELANNIGSKIINFEVPPSLIHGYISTLSQITSLSSTQEKRLFNDILNNDFYRNFNQVFSDTESSDAPSDQLLARYLSTIGEAAVCFSKCSVPEKFVTLVQGLIASSIAKVRRTSSNGHSSSISRTSISPTVQAHAFATLGKLCLMNEKLSRNSEKIFVRELQQAAYPEVRNNILVALCDLCVRYTGVDRYMARIAERMRDDSLLVRRNAATLLTQLLAEDYIKWDPILFFRFLSVLADGENQIVRTAEHALTNILPRKQPHMLYNHFIESIFVLNDCREHSVYNQFPQSETEIKFFTLPSVEGDEFKTRLHRSKRYIIYKFLLNQLSAEYKLRLHGRLHAEVISDFSDGKINSEGVLLDVFAILSSQDMKLDRAAATSGDQDAADPTSQVSSQMVSEILKRHIRDNVLPVLVDLKKNLERRKSPLLGNLMDYFHSISMQYPNEVKDLLKNDRQLRGEFEFDMRRRARAAAAANTPLTALAAAHQAGKKPTPHEAALRRTNLSLPSLTSTSKKKRRSGFYEGPKSSTPAPRILSSEFKSPRGGGGGSAGSSSVSASKKNGSGSRGKPRRSTLTTSQGNAILSTPAPGLEKQTDVSHTSTPPTSIQKALFGANRLPGNNNTTTPASTRRNSFAGTPSVARVLLGANGNDSSSRKKKKRMSMHNMR